MQRRLTQRQRAYIRLLAQKLNVFLDYVLGAKHPAPTKPTAPPFDPMLLFSRRQIKRQIYKRFDK
jgi:hypothetical protein